MPDITSDALAERVLNTLGALDVFSIYLGERLGYYKALRSGEFVSPAELARRTDTNERYALEWLEQQAATGFVDVEERDGDRVFCLGPAAIEVFADPDSVHYMAAVARRVVSATAPLDDLVDAYRTGAGWSTIAIARRLGVELDGIDIDAVHRAGSREPQGKH